MAQKLGQFQPLTAHRNAWANLHLLCQPDAFRTPAAYAPQAPSSSARRWMRRGWWAASRSWPRRAGAAASSSRAGRTARRRGARQHPRCGATARQLPWRSSAARTTPSTRRSARGARSRPGSDGPVCVGERRVKMYLAKITRREHTHEHSLSRQWVIRCIRIAEI